MSCTLSPWLPPPKMGAKSGSNIKSLWLDFFVFVCSDSLNYLYWGCVIAHAGRHNPQMSGWDGASPIPGTRQVVFKLRAPCGPPFKIPSTPGQLHAPIWCCAGGIVSIFSPQPHGSEEETPAWVRSRYFQCTTTCKRFVVKFFSCCKNKMWFFWLK